MVVKYLSKPIKSSNASDKKTASDYATRGFDKWSKPYLHNLPDTYERIFLAFAARFD